MSTLDPIVVKISPSAFSVVKEELLRAELLGYGPYHSVRLACARVGFWPKDGTETILVVDYSLPGTSWPFEEKDSDDWIAERAEMRRHRGWPPPEPKP